jgi:hypothetical protein
MTKGADHCLFRWQFLTDSFLLLRMTLPHGLSYNCFLVQPKAASGFSFASSSLMLPVKTAD